MKSLAFLTGVLTAAVAYGTYDIMDAWDGEMDWPKLFGLGLSAEQAHEFSEAPGFEKGWMAGFPSLVTLRGIYTTRMMLRMR